MSVNIHAAKTHFSKLVQRAAAGEEIVIARAGIPVAKLVPYEPSTVADRQPGYWKGRVTLDGGWDSEETNEEIAGMFYGGEDGAESSP